MPQTYQHLLVVLHLVREFQYLNVLGIAHLTDQLGEHQLLPENH